MVDRVIKHFRESVPDDSGYVIGDVNEDSGLCLKAFEYCRLI
jgi:hypothetical protein